MPIGRFQFAHCDRPLPCPPGTSPYRIKGAFFVQLQGVIENAERKSNGALTALLETDGLLPFVRQRFLASGWYDVLPYPYIFMAIARSLDRDLVDLTGKLGRASVEEQMAGVYRSLFANITIKSFGERLGLIIGYIYDHAPVTVTVDTAGRSAQVARRSIPLCIAEWWCIATIPFITVPLAANGTEGVRVGWRIAEAGEKGGIALGDAHWDVRWSGTSNGGR